jgi:REP element-mobilizing transposase RayT
MTATSPVSGAEARAQLVVPRSIPIMYCCDKLQCSACGAGCQPAADCQSAMRILKSRSHLMFVMIIHFRRLPHHHAIGHPIFLTWRLHGSLPVGRRFPAGTSSGEAFAAMDRLLDNARTAPLYLRQREIAGMVAEAIQFQERALGHYQLHSYVVMANHVHLLVTPAVKVSKLTQSLKRFTAREGNRMLGLTGKSFWQEESYDRLVRDETEFRRIARYIENNPVKAGLVKTPEEFLWSSARPIANRPQVGNLPHS